MPVKLHVVCPSCGAQIEVDLDDAAISAMAHAAGMVGDGMDARWSSSVMVDPRDGDIAGWVPARDGGGELMIRTAKYEFVSLPARVGPPLPGIVGSPRPLSWGLERLVAGVWRVSPSVVAGTLHVVVMLIGVPEPAPFEGEAGEVGR